MPLNESPYLHGMEGAVQVAGDGTVYVEVDATSWEGNPFEVDRHVFATFRTEGANVALPGLESGRDVTITAKARKDEDIRGAEQNIVEGNLLPVELVEPGMAKGSGHRGEVLITSVFSRIVANAEMEYQIRGVSSGKWTRGTKVLVP